MAAAAQRFELPALPGRLWHSALDTGGASPLDVTRPEDQIALEPGPLVLRSRSVVVLESRPNRGYSLRN